jgi:prevent-host-death family protein
MIAVTVTEAKNKLSAVLARVKAGETVIVTERGIPVARVEPAVVDVADGDEGRLARLERKGIVRRARGSLPQDFFATPPPATRSGESVVDAVLEEREEGW